MSCLAIGAEDTASKAVLAATAAVSAWGPGTRFRADCAGYSAAPPLRAGTTPRRDAVDAISLLIQDHETVEQLFGQFEQTADPGERRRLVDRMIEELSVHAAIEEQELYPVMHRVLPDDDVDEAEHEHAEAKAVIAVLAQLDAEDPPFEAMVQELIADVRHHVEEEEDELFPQFRQAVSQSELEDLGLRLEQAKQAAPRKPSAKDLQALTRDELYEFAQTIDLDGRSDMSKDDLAKALAP